MNYASFTLMHVCLYVCINKSGMYIIIVYILFYLPLNILALFGIVWCTDFVLYVYIHCYI